MHKPLARRNVRGQRRVTDGHAAAAYQTSYVGITSRLFAGFRFPKSVYGEMIVGNGRITRPTIGWRRKKFSRPTARRYSIMNNSSPYSGTAAPLISPLEYVRRIRVYVRAYYYYDGVNGVDYYLPFVSGRVNVPARPIIRTAKPTDVVFV